MSSVIPTPLRALAGLAAATIDEARRAPKRLVALPVVAVSTVLQASLAAQQRYADLVVRGDELLAQLQSDDDSRPGWATFDDDLPADLADDPVPGSGPDPAAGTAAGTAAAPVEGYDDLSIAALRARLRSLSTRQLEALLAYEERRRNRPPYLTMLQNRLANQRER